MSLSHLLLGRLKCSKPLSICLLSQIPKPMDFSSIAAAPDSAHQPTPKPTSLSARMSFLFEQMDEIDKNREEKDQTLQRIRTWRESKKHNDSQSADPSAGDSMDRLKLELEKSEEFLGKSDVKKEVELVHPWPEWIEFMERLLQQNYFDQRRKDEDRMMEGLGFDVSEAKTQEDKRLDFARDFKTVETAVVNFGRDRFDILRSLSRQDLQILVGYGCLSADKKVVFSSKLLRKLVHLDEGDVCSSCSLRTSCEKAYLLINKEDEARTIDVMRILLDYGFDPVAGSVANKSVLKNKSVKTVVRKLLHEVVKLSAVPIDPNLTPPVYKRPPPKVKQPPPPPKRRVGRNDIEMKKGDWLCLKCDFMNFAKNTVCLQCDAKRPKRQLLPGEWECPQCNFLNYRRNTVCFHCEHKRPPDTYADSPSQFSEKQRGPLNRMERTPSRRDVSDAWNFDFDDNESDGADVAAFEYADSKKLDEDFPPSHQAFGGSSRGHEDGFERSNRPPKGFEKEYPDSSSTKPGVGFNDFDEEDDDDDVDSYELVAQNEMPKTSRIDFSELEADTESEDVESSEDNWQVRGITKFPRNSRKQMARKTFSGSEDDDVSFDTDDDLPIHPKWKSSHVANPKQQNRGRDALAFGSDNGLGSSSGSDDETIRSRSKGNRGGSNGMDRGRRGGRSNYNASISEGDSDDEMTRPKSRGNIRGSNVMGRGRGGRSNFNASFSEGDSDDEMRPKSRGNRNEMGRGRGGRSSYNASFSEGDSDDEMMRPKSKGNRNEMGCGRGGRSNFKPPYSDEDKTMRSKSRGNRNDVGRGRGGRSNFKSSYSDEDETMRSKSRGNRRGGGFNGMERGRRGGGISNFKASFSDRDYDDERGGRNGPRKGSRGGGRNNDFDRSSTGRKSFNSSRGGREDSFKGREKNDRQGGSFGKRGGRSNNFDSGSGSYEVDERQERPRNNVR